MTARPDPAGARPRGAAVPPTPQPEPEPQLQPQPQPQPQPWILWDGDVREAGAVGVSPLDRTVLYGLGAFETVRLYAGRPFLIERHLARLEHSLAALGLPCPPGVADVPGGVVALAARAGRPSALCRVTATAGPEGAGVEAMHVYALLRPAPEPPAPGSVRVGLVPFAHEGRSPLVGVKSTSYLVHYVLRERAQAAGRYEDLMVDEAGRVREGTVSNVFIVRAGRLATPALAEGLLPGVTRGVVLELAAELGIPVEARVLLEPDLLEADEAFLTGAGKGLVPIDELDGRRRYPARRPVADALRRALAARIAACCGAAPGDVRF